MPLKRRRGRARTQRPRSSKRLTHAAWTRLVERATLERPPGDNREMREAHDNFLRLQEREQMQLARELVRTRRGELTRAYADVIGVAAGYRLCDDERTPVIEREVCVTFVVKRKKTAVARSRRVPEVLFAYWTVGTGRVLCAIRTDVDDGAAHRRAEPLAQAAIEATVPQAPEPAPGVVACAVRGNEGIYAISCRHVFGLALALDPARDDADIQLPGGGKRFAQGTSHAGTLANHVQWSFDSQLALTSDLDGLAEALGDVIFASRALGWDDLNPDAEAWILTARAGPIRTRFAKQYFDPIRYTAKLTDVRHRALAYFVTAPGALGRGDSGSPVASAPGGGKLFGMLIAGDRDTRAYVIPAWQLLQPDNYGLHEGPWEFWPPA